jgi:hypothetical protein
MTKLHSLALALVLGSAGTLAACQGCQPPDAPRAATDAGVTSQPPTLRIVALSSVAGALEPCGCSKDQLGGANHLAAWLAAEQAKAPSRLVVGAGPMLFLNPLLEPDRKTQDEWKAEAIAGAVKGMGLAAWAPGANDWAAGAPALERYKAASGAALLASNAKSDPPGLLEQGPLVREVGGLKVALIGLAEPKDRFARVPAGVTTSDALAALRADVAKAKAAGARVLVGLAAMPRGDALRLVDAVPELAVLVVGKPSESGDGNDAQKPPVLIGNTVIVETSNHLQTVSVVDLWVDEADMRGAGVITFSDGGGVAKAGEVVSLAARIRELEARINGWKKSPKTNPKDLAEREAELEKLRGEKAKVEASETAAKGSVFRYQTVEVREGLGSDKGVYDAMRAYYKKVNDHNKVAFADRKPEPPPEGQAGFVGLEKCSECHAEERKVWDATPHSVAYETLQGDFKEYNLECVSCHVTGYAKPGGSTVTHNDKLRGVQCEECHGPGSLHVAEPKKPGLVLRSPPPQMCVTACHHPPHVEGFDPVAKRELILGKGHGR